MLKIIRVGILVCVGVFQWALATAADAPKPYTLTAGDSLQISVWREESLQKEVKVLPDGSITYPLAGRIVVAGLSTTEAEKQIAVKLKEFIPEAIVTVVILSVDGNLAYVLGKVQKSGPIILSGPTTVLQALSIAGGLDKFADLGSIKIIRRNGSESLVLPVNYKNLISGTDLSSNVEMMAGDTLLVP